jgi:hypothetical protein
MSYRSRKILEDKAAKINKETSNSSKSQPKNKDDKSLDAKKQET